MKPKRLPNGFGQISKLSGNRSRPYMVRLSNRKVIGYEKTYEEAYLLLCEYNKNPWDVNLHSVTFGDLWEIFSESLDSYSKSAAGHFKSNYKNYVSQLENVEVRSFKTYHYLKFVESLGCSDNTKREVVTLLKHLEDIAYQLDIIDKKYAHELKVKRVEKQSEAHPFSECEIKTLWDHTDNDMVAYTLILIYTGFRIGEFLNVKREDIDFDNWTITGGSKSTAGKNRVVPVHPRIRPLIKRFIERDGTLCTLSLTTFRRKYRDMQKDLGFSYHKPHDCRHTCRSRLDSAGAPQVTIDKILGHKSGDTGRDIYTHKSVAELQAAMALVK